MTFLKTVFFWTCVFASTLAHGQKVGLVLSGGGAKGIAHIGVLKALEENNIPIDYITGTSMGGIVGAMYAAGYTPAEMEKIALDPDFQNWVSGKYKSDYRFFFDKNGSNASVVSAKLSIDTNLRLSFRSNLVNDIPLNFALMELLSQASAVAKGDFNKLFVPFRCMVSDVQSQRSIAIGSGSLSDAVRATMTVPFVYRPIKVNEQYVFDGGLYNNFPADIMQSEFKPDRIIGINVSSKITRDNPEGPDDRMVNRLLTYMLLAKSDSTLVGKKGIYIQPDLTGFTATGFQPVSELIRIGYEAAIKDMPRIKSEISRRVSEAELGNKRAEFNANKPDFIFQRIITTGVNSQQKKYIERLFNSEQTAFTLRDVKRAYYKLVADETFETVYPKIVYNAENDSYDFEIAVKPRNNFKVDFGGNISSRPISNVFLGLRYSFLNNKAYSAGANFYSGRFYESVQVSGRIDYPSRLPLFLEGDITYNHFNYYTTSQIFIENPHPTYMEQSDRKIELKMGFPLNYNGKVTINTAFINNEDQYSPTRAFNLGDVLDRTVFNGWKIALALEKNSLNRKQYASSGRNFMLSGSYLFGKENYSAGNILRSTSFNNSFEITRHYRKWGMIKLSDENYFLQRPGYSFAYLAELVLSNQPLYSNYFGTLLSAPAFYPLQDSRSIFLEHFRAPTYAAAGVKNVIRVRKNLDARIEGFLFLPYRELYAVNVQEPRLRTPFSTWHYAATAGLVYHTPVGPISLSYNRYDDPAKRNGVLLHLGFLIYNKRSLE